MGFPLCSFPRKLLQVDLVSTIHIADKEYVSSFIPSFINLVLHRLYCVLELILVLRDCSEH